MVGIDGGYVRAGERGRTHRDANFEVVVGQSIAEDRDSRYFGLVQSFDDKPKRRLHEVLREQGLMNQMNQDITFLTDGGDGTRFGTWRRTCLSAPSTWRRERIRNSLTRTT